MFDAVCFQPIKALTRWIFFHFHRALQTDAESSGKRSCQGTLSSGADASGEWKVETMSEKEETAPPNETRIRREEDTIKNFEVHLEICCLILDGLTTRQPAAFAGRASGFLPNCPEASPAERWGLPFRRRSLTACCLYRRQRSEALPEHPSY